MNGAEEGGSTWGPTTGPDGYGWPAEQYRREVLKDAVGDAIAVNRSYQNPAGLEKMYRSAMAELVNLSLRSRKMTKVQLQKELVRLVQFGHDMNLKADAAARDLREQLRDVEKLQSLVTTSFDSAVQVLLGAHKDLEDESELPQR